MNKLLASTAVCLVMGTAAIAQSPGSSNSSSPSAQPSATQRQNDQRQNESSPSNSSQPSSSSQPASSSNQPSANSTQATPSTNSAASQPASGQPANPTASQSPAPSGNTSQAQGNAPAAQQGGSSTPSQTQGSNPPSQSNQAQQTPNTGNANTGNANTGTANTGNANTNTTAQQPAQPNQTNTAQSSSNNVNASVNLNEQQRTRVSQSFARLNVHPLTNVNFSVSVGTVVPRDVHLQTVPADIVEVVPQYRGYSFFAVRDEIVIVDPASYKIVTVLPRSGGSTAAAPASTRSKVSFTDKDREVVRRHAHSSASTERRTTGSSASSRVEIRRGERVPDTVEIEEFPETVYREAPALREYRYIHRDSRTYVVEPSERRVIEEID
jgi:hypothetical protein